MTLRRMGSILIGALCAFAVLNMTPILFAQGSTQAAGSTTVLAQVSAAFSNGTQVGSVQLTGRVQRYAGADTDSGSVVLSGSADGSTEVQMNLSSGQRTEIQTATNVGRTCQWSGPDGTKHDASGPNCWPSLVWFLPQISLQPAKLSPLLSTFDGGTQPTSVGTFRILQNQVIASSFSKSAAAVLQIQAHSTMTLFIDPATMTPRLLGYTIHSDSGSVAIPVEIRFSNYQRIAGLMIPTHIERRLYGGLEYAIDINQVTILN